MLLAKVPTSSTTITATETQAQASSRRPRGEARLEAAGGGVLMLMSAPFDTILRQIGRAAQRRRSQDRHLSRGLVSPG